MVINVKSRSLKEQVHISKNYIHFFEFNHKIYNNGEWRLNQLGGLLKD